MMHTSPATSLTYQQLELSIGTTKDRIRSEMRRYFDYDNCRASIEK